MCLTACPDCGQQKGDEGGKWTSKYLNTNEGLRDIVNTLLELAFLPPHRWEGGGC